MQRRTFLQGLLALPLIGVAAKAFSGEKPKLKSPGVPVREIDESVSNAFPQITHVLFFNRDRIKSKGWEGIVPIMVLRDRKTIPLKALEQCDAAVDMKTMRCVKHRYDHTWSTWTEEQHKEFAMTAFTRAYFHMGDKEPYELTDEIRVKNEMDFAFANLCDSKTGEML